MNPKVAFVLQALLSQTSYFLCFYCFISFVKGICARSNHVIQALLATTQTKIPSLDVGRVLKDIEGMEFNAYLLPANKDPLPAFRY